MRNYSLGVLIIVVLCLSMLGIKPGQAFADNVRIIELKYSQGLKVGKPSIDGDLIVWTEEVEEYYPCYLKISEGNIYKLENSTNNKEIIAVSKGVLVYRNYGDDRLVVTNIGEDVKFGLEPGESTIISDLKATGFYQVNEDIIVFLVGGVRKDFYLFTNKNETPKHMFSTYARNLNLSNYKGQHLIVWYYDGKLFYTDLDEPKNDNELNTVNGIKSEYICTYGNQVVYFDNKYNLNIQEIACNSEPRLVPVDADYLPVYLIDDRIYYIDKEMNICFYDLRTLENTNVVKLDYSPVSLASNGKDIVWNYDSKSYWYAGLLDFKLEGIQELVEKGDIFQLSLVALYTNKQLADVTEGAKWYSSNGEVIAIEGGWCEALSSGTAIVTVEYEGQQLSTPIVVREAMKLEIFPQKAELPRGAIEQFKAYLVYSDGSRVDVTNEAVWVSELNVIEKGLYRADKLGIDNIEVHYDDFNASLTIVINDLDYKEPDEPKDDEPQPKTKPKSSSNQTRHDNIDEGVPVFKAAQFDEIVRGESCYFDIIRLCLKLLFPYPLGWEI